MSDTFDLFETLATRKTIAQAIREAGLAGTKDPVTGERVALLKLPGYTNADAPNGGHPFTAGECAAIAGTIRSVANRNPRSMAEVVQATMRQEADGSVSFYGSHAERSRIVKVADPEGLAALFDTIGVRLGALNDADAADAETAEGEADEG